MFAKILKKIEGAYQYLIEERLIKKSKTINISSVKTICFIAGPYRNLTSLTAAIAVLHPNCQVLNHAKDRIFPHNSVDFFRNYSDSKFERFIQYAILLSQSGKRGNYGGSITFSHAFDKSLMKEIYTKRFDNSLLKKNIQCLFWKEGLYVRNHMQEHNIHPSTLIQKNKKIRFVLPIRNPLDCALSNKKTNLALIYNHLKIQSSIHDIIKTILDDFLAFFKNQKKHPKFFFHFFQHSFDSATLERFCMHLELPFDSQWEADIFRVYNIKPSYDHSESDITFYRKYVTDHFKGFPAEQKKLLQFLD